MKRSTTGRRAALPAALVLGSLVLAGCSAPNEEPAPGAEGTASPSGGAALSGELNGAGATSQSSAMEAWIAGFTEVQPDVTVNYDAAGSGAGREQFIASGVSFAGSDAYLDEEELTAAQERCAGGDAIGLPLYISPIAVIYNLEGVDELNLTPATIAKIFNQQITDWSDPAITADNGGTALPAGPITPVNRADDSGTTENFMEYLVATAGADFPHEPDGVWPVEGGEAAQGTDGVVQAVTGGTGTIGYADASRAGDLGVVSIGVGEGFEQPTPEAAAAVVDASPAAESRPEGDLAIDLDRSSTEAGAYPLVLVSYTIACTTYEDAEEAERVKAFLTYIASEEGQTAAAENAGSAPISADLRTQVETSIESITAAS
ncbi:MAG: Phosphate ABC transporter, periplasmic phosphate-binding protein PstS [uncultured Quadrisphaera sp.]|uniref:Phosphate-binding protein n=1 Tax=uncultured Quadrisphaera sp. TaxID=904978 RepID=A0A6J4NJG7_9ACTN|nr:MAG: Phosphate ABC transporter, periplasmic phosphate-binding protein PstS [uncultured Quadrisphaera sp.]